MVSRRHAAARERTSDAHKCLQLRAALLQRCSNHFDGHVAVLFSVEPSVRWEKKKGGEAISGGDLRFVSGHAGAFSRSQLSGCGVLSPTSARTSAAVFTGAIAGIGPGKRGVCQFFSGAVRVGGSLGFRPEKPPETENSGSRPVGASPPAAACQHDSRPGDSSSIGGLNFDLDVSSRLQGPFRQNHNDKIRPGPTPVTRQVDDVRNGRRG